MVGLEASRLEEHTQPRTLDGAGRPLAEMTEVTALSWLPRFVQLRNREDPDPDPDPPGVGAPNGSHSHTLIPRVRLKIYS